MKFEVPQRQQLASERTSLTLFAPAPSTISFVPLTRNLSLADSSPYPVRGWTGLSEATATRFSVLRKAREGAAACPGPLKTHRVPQEEVFVHRGPLNERVAYHRSLFCAHEYLLRTREGGFRHRISLLYQKSLFFTPSAPEKCAAYHRKGFLRTECP